MLFWLILLAILLLLFILLCIPVTIYVSYKEKWCLRVKYIFTWFTYPSEKKKKKTKHKKKQEPAEKKQEEPQQWNKIKNTIQMVLDIIRSTCRPVHALLRKIKVYDVILHAQISTGDAAETAIAYGKFSAYFYGLYAAAQNFVTITLKEVIATPIFNDEVTQSSYIFSFRVRASLGRVLLTGIWVFFRFIKLQAKKPVVEPAENLESTSQNAEETTIK